MKNLNTLLSAAFVACCLSASAQATFAPSQSSFPGSHRSSVYAADFNNDGKLDVYYRGQLDPQLDNKPGIWGWTTLSTMLLNNGNDSWTADCLTAVENDEPGEDGSYSYHIVGTQNGIRLGSYDNFAGIDYNNDGLVDLLVFGRDGSDDWFMPEEMKVNHLSLYRNNGDGTFTLEEKAVFPICSPDNDGVGFSLAVGDYDRDGYVDFFVIGNLDDSEKVNDTYPGRITRLYRNVNGTGEFENMLIADTKGGVWTSEVKDENETVVTPKQPLEGWFLPMGGNVHFADLNNDGWLDIVIDGWADNVWDGYHVGGNAARIYINEEGKKFVDVTPEDASFYTLRSSSSNIADVNGDGYLDFFMTGWGDNGYGWEAFLFTHTGDDSIYDLPADHNELGLDGTEKVKTYIRDFDGDGVMDILYAGYQDKVVIFYGNLMGTFEKKEYEDYTYGGSGFGVAADLNGNGLADIFQIGYGANGSEAKLYYNTTEASLETPEMPANVKAEIVDGVLNITWDAVAGAEEANLQYNIFVKNGESLYCLVPADPETGFVKVSNERLSALRPNITSYSMPVSGENVTVGVQAISLMNETYSKFNTVSTNAAVESVAADTTAPSVTVDANGIVVEGNGENVKVVNMLGQTVAAGVAGQHINVEANGVLLVMVGNHTVKVVK